MTLHKEALKKWKRKGPVLKTYLTVKVKPSENDAVYGKTKHREHFRQHFTIPHSALEAQ